MLSTAHNAQTYKGGGSGVMEDFLSKQTESRYSSTREVASGLTESYEGSPEGRLGTPTLLAERESPSRFLQIIDDPWYQLLVELQDTVAVETTMFWRSRGARYLNLPITTSSISSPMGLGSDSSPVKITLFGVETYLADSMQFMLEYGCRFSKDGCYYLMPSFRGEEADTSHLNQFFHSEAEIVGSLEDVMGIVDSYVRHLANAIVDRHQVQLRLHAEGTGHIEEVANLDGIPRISFDEAVEILDDEPSLITHDTGGWRNLTRLGEQELMRLVSPIVWVTGWDHLAVPFYQAFGNSTRESARNGDLLLGIGEVAGCGERHETGRDVRDALALHRVNEADYKWYVDLKEHRPLRTSGFGLGVERFLMWVMGHRDIRDLQLLPRYNGVANVP
mgnify:CR=1 FL=1